MLKEVNLVEFCEKVERLCDFFLDQIPRDGSERVSVLEDIKTEAQNLQDQTRKEISFQGLDAYMRGHINKEQL